MNQYTPWEELGISKEEYLERGYVKTINGKILKRWEAVGLTETEYFKREFKELEQQHFELQLKFASADSAAKSWMTFGNKLEEENKKLRESVEFWKYIAEIHGDISYKLQTELHKEEK